jgi:RimJ/RimL family protein N-acetyltransferase
VFEHPIAIPSYQPARLRLIEPKMSHAALSLKWLRDDEASRYMGADFSAVSLATEHQRIKDILSGTDNINWMITVDRKIIGAVEINKIAESSKKFGAPAGSLSILIGDRSQWGRGIGSAVLAAVIEWGFIERRFQCFLARALTVNTRSWHSLESLGFTYIDTTTEHEDGQVFEWRNYRLTKDDWATARAKSRRTVLP